MSSTLTHEEEQQIADWLADHPTLTEGVGNAEAACSVAAWNLALTGTLTDKIPDCASEVIGRWIIRVQDSCPPEHGRGHPEWLRLLPLAAGTGRAHEAERLAIVMDWMWGTVLPSVQIIADGRGFGKQWREMCEARTEYAANAAADAAVYAAAYAAEYAANAAADAANAAADAAVYAAAYAAEYAANAAADAADVVADVVADAAAYAADVVADVVADAAYVSEAAARRARRDVWATFAPVEVLRKLIAVTDARAVA